MYKGLALLILTAPAFLSGVQAQEPERQSISAGDVYTFELAGSDPVLLTLDARGTALIKITNIGRDSILTISDVAGNRLIRAAGWRGPEHYYYATVDLEGPVELMIEPDVPISPAGQVRVQVVLGAHDAAMIAAERRMTTASDLIIAYYYGEANTRLEALNAFREAAGLFGDAGMAARQADALFEAANVSDALCYRAQTHELLGAAGAIWAALDDQASLAASENLRGLAHWATGNGDAAIALFDSAAIRRERPREDYFYAESINNLGLVHREVGDARLAAEYFREALEIWSGDADFLSKVLDGSDLTSNSRVPWLQHSLTAVSNVGWASEVFGDVQETEAIWSAALELTENLKNDFVASTLRNNLGSLKRKSGEMQEAMQLLEEALTYFTEESPDDYWAGLVHFNIAQLYRDLGDRTRALESLRQSLALRTPDCDPTGRADVLREIAEIEVNAGQIEPAIALIHTARQLLAPYPGNDVSEARLLELEGMAYAQSDRLADALARFDEAIRTYRSAGDRYGELTTRTHRARTHSLQGQHFAAIAELRTALGLAESVDSRLESFRVMTALGETYLASGDTEIALEHARRALDLSETVREQLVRPILLRDFASVQRNAYDILVQAYISLGEEEYIEDAWIAADSGRARRFSDVIRQSDVDSSLLSEEQRIRYDFLIGAIAQRAEARTELLIRNDQEAADSVLRELLPLVDELDVLHEQARRPGSGPADTVSLADLQQSLSENDVILEYYLGSSISGVWSISKEGLEFAEIPGGEQILTEIETSAASLRQRGYATAANLRALSEKYFAVTAARNESKTNVVIIPDGPLHYIPFATLPDPATGYSEPLVASRNVSHLPSIRALTELRHRDRVQGEGIAIIADPVFQADDPRVRREDTQGEQQKLAFLDRELFRSAERNGLAGFPRLPGTLDEARAIEAAAVGMKVLALYGANANRDIVVSGDLRPYRILHFATHGVLDDEEPALSGIVLSGVTLDGQRRSSFLRTQDIVGLALNAELVVLSGCETGLGRAVNGEGLLGLSRAFFYAGAEQVISTLWQVPDDATAELMGHFYRSLLQEGASAPEALRQAQLEIRKVDRWQDPFYWAPFILQGDWSDAMDPKGAIN